MLAELGYPTLDALIDAAVPGAIREHAPLSLEAGVSEQDALAQLRALADRNEVFTSLIGLGYSDTITPPVILRNVLENPAWYTAYTPYQPEISQGRLEALVNFQTMVTDLTGMEIANASLLDEATAAAEAMALLHRVNGKAGDVFFVDADCLPQTIAVLQTRAEPLGIAVVVGDPDGDNIVAGCFGVLLQYPGASGRVRDLRARDRAGARGRRAAWWSRPISSRSRCSSRRARWAPTSRSALRSGSACRSASADRTPRTSRRATSTSARCPGRLVGVSIDAEGRHRVPPDAADARAAHPPREGDEQHLHRPGAARRDRRPVRRRTTAPSGLRAIARARARARLLVGGRVSRAAGVEVVHDAFFDTLTRARSRPGRGDRGRGARRGASTCVSSTATRSASRSTRRPRPRSSPRWRRRSARRSSTTRPRRDSRRAATHVGVPHASGVLVAPVRAPDAAVPARARRPRPRARPHDDPARLVHDEAQRDRRDGAGHLARVRAIHPFAPAEQAAGYHELVDDLERWLAEITGYDAVSLQPNAGSQGEYAGLLAIRRYHDVAR